MPDEFFLLTPKIILRQVTMNDDEKKFEAMSCPEVHAMHSNGFTNISDVRRYIPVLINEYQNSNFRTLAIAEKNSNELCGTITIDIHKFFSRAELGYWISIPHRNKDYASEAVRAVINYGFSELSLKRIQAGHSINKPASGRVLEKAGMTYEGTLRQYNGISDEKIYSVIESDLTKGNISKKSLKVSVIPLKEDLISFVHNAFKQNIEILHGISISENEWHKYLLGEDADPYEMNFIFLAEQNPAAWLKINGINSETICISMLIIDNTYKRQGIGSFMMKYSEEYAKNHNKSAVRIQTTKDNIAATQCYLRQGYKINEIKYAVGDGVLTDGYEFTKSLKP
jgi:ribosomal-protein-alanine N-acetyltransferase